MLRKLFVLISLSALLSLVSYAQDEAPKPDERRKAETVYSFAFGGGSYLGIQVKEVTKENYTELGLREVRGVGVEKVFENSPAEKAGLQAGDVIVGFNGEAVTSTRKLTRLISEVTPDHTVELSVIRGGSEIKLPVTIGKRERPGLMGGTFVFPTPPDPPTPLDLPDFEPPEAPDFRIFTPEGSAGQNYVRAFGQRRTIGIGVDALTKQLGEYFGTYEGKGLLITSVEKDSPADKAGLRAGDVIVEAGGKAVAKSSDLVKALNAEKDGDVTLTIVRDKQQRTVTVTPETTNRGNFLIDRLRTEGVRSLAAPRSLIRVAPGVRGVASPVLVRPGTRVL